MIQDENTGLQLSIYFLLNRPLNQVRSDHKPQLHMQRFQRRFTAEKALSSMWPPEVIRRGRLNKLQLH